jgi:hypothetical protein
VAGAYSSSTQVLIDMVSERLSFQKYASFQKEAVEKIPGQDWLS